MLFVIALLVAGVVVVGWLLRLISAAFPIVLGVLFVVFLFAHDYRPSDNHPRDARIVGSTLINTGNSAYNEGTFLIQIKNVSRHPLKLVSVTCQSTDRVLPMNNFSKSFVNVLDEKLAVGDTVTVRRVGGWDAAQAIALNSAPVVVCRVDTAY